MRLLLRPRLGAKILTFKHIRNLKKHQGNEQALIEQLNGYQEIQLWD